MVGRSNISLSVSHLMRLVHSHHFYLYDLSIHSSEKRNIFGRELRAPELGDEFAVAYNLSSGLCVSSSCDMTSHTSLLFLVESKNIVKRECNMSIYLFVVCENLWDNTVYFCINPNLNPFLWKRKGATEFHKTSFLGFLFQRKLSEGVMD